jgi:hypothetical protein
MFSIVETPVSLSAGALRRIIAVRARYLVASNAAI